MVFEGETYTGGDMNAKIVDFYERLFTETESWRPKMDNMVFPMISDIDRAWMERDFEREKVLCALRGYGGRIKHQGQMVLLWLFFRSAGL